MADPAPTQLGRYQLLERLAVGGMAELWKARVIGAHGFQKPVVIKKILPHLAADASFVAMFIDEANITARLDHPKIAQVLELGTIQDQLYMAMEYVDGIDVLALLRQSAGKGQPLAPLYAVHIAHEVLDALDYAHQARDEEGNRLGIVHRDISPSNVLLSRRGDVKLADFGIAHAVERQQKTQAGTLKGKYGYMSPEQVVGSDLDGRSDLFSVSILLAEMLMGRHLFTAPNHLDVLLMVRDVRLDRLEKYGAAIDPSLRKILLRGLQRDPKDRWPTAGAFRDALAEWLYKQSRRVGPAELAGYVEGLFGGEFPRPAGAPPSGRSMAGPAPAGLADSRPGVTGRTPATAQGAGSKQATPVGHRAATTAPGMATRAREAAPAKPAAPSVKIPPSIDDGDFPIVLDLGQLKTPPPPTAGPALPVSPPPEEDHEILIMASEPAPAPRVQKPISVEDRFSLPPESQERLTLEPTNPGARRSQPRLADEDEETAVEQPPAVATPASASAGGSEPDFSDLNDEIGLSPVAAPPTPAIGPATQMALPTPAPVPTLGTIATPPDEEGDVTRTSPLRLLYRLATARETGLLVIEISSMVKEIYLVDGTPEYVRSNVAREFLGEYLVAKNVISSGELAMALAMMPHFGGKIGDTLVGLGLMQPLDVFRYITQQVRDKIVDALTWQKGRYRFYRGRKNPREAFPLGLDAFEVLGGGAMAFSADVLEAWASPLMSSVPSPGEQPPVPFEAFRMGAEPQRVLALVDGRSTLRELLAGFMRAEDRLQFLRVLHLLVQTGIASFPAETGRARRAR